MYDFRSIKHIEGLDGLRLIAVGLVLLGHFGIPGVPGGLGVTIFFFLSGFLITTLLFQENRSNGSIAIGKFYIRRFLRLGPELLGLIAISSIVGIASGNAPHLLDVLAAIFYLSNYYFALVYANAFDTNQPYWSHLWSLAVEEHYYLSFPVIFVWMLKRPSRPLIFFAAVLVGCLLWRTYLVVERAFPLDWVNPYTYMASEARIDSIAYGAILAFVAQRNVKLPSLAGQASLVIGGGLLLFTLVVRNDVFRETVRYSLQGIALMLIFAHLYLTPQRSWVMPVLENRVMQLGGLLSYGAYLWHGEVLRIIHHFGLDLRTGPVAMRVFAIPAGIALTFVIAGLSYRFVARPALRLRRKYGSHATS